MTRINKAAIDRIKGSPGGEDLVKIFEGMATRMEMFGSPAEMTQMQLVDDQVDDLEDGDLIPEIHFLLVTYHKPEGD